ncbi:MAG: polysaccharide deacetylase family protein [Desulfovibrio sp.]|jgi:peptidoglycan/xylan/chitin deacetylase (PgdA/CDA1 family)|nr:polysaccharide deacetylase family protein [Desulfovibrio sp.]
MTERFATARAPLLTLLLSVALAAPSVCVPAAQAAATPAKPRAAGPAAPAPRPAGPLSLWSAEQLAEPKDPAQAKAERAMRHLPQPDANAPARTAPVESAPRLPDAWRGIIRRVQLPAGDKRVALTFDLCERAATVAGYDARLVDALRAANAKATFFAGGKWMRSHPERTLQLLADRRFEFGSHSWSHANMEVAPAEFRQRQLDWTAAQYELLEQELDRRLTAKGMPPMGRGPMRLFRLPFGRGGAEVARLLNHNGLAVIQWDVVGEGGHGNAQARAQAIADAVRPGSIVLLHANAVPKDTAEVLRRLLPLLARKGYATATVSELLATGHAQTVPEGFFSFPGDNAIYDDMFAAWGTGERLKPSPKHP